MGIQGKEREEAEGEKGGERRKGRGSRQWGSEEGERAAEGGGK